MKFVASLFTLAVFFVHPGAVAAQEGGSEKPKTDTPRVVTTDKVEPCEPGKGTPANQEDCTNCADKQMVPAGAKAKVVDLEKGMKLKVVTPIADILAAPDKFEGKRVLVKGPAVGVCETRGCWVNLRSEKDARKALRVKVEDGEIVFPMTLLGQEVQAEGVIEKLVIPVETLRAAAKKQAEAKGQPFDPESIQEPRVVWQLKGLGARFDAPKVEPPKGELPKVETPVRPEKAK